MNRSEEKMVEILERSRENFGVISVKAEFEAEGTRTDEFLRLIDIARSAGLPVTLKIGGCEAIRDLFEAKQFGVKYIVAPMIETPYALTKYIQARDHVFSLAEQENMHFLFNMETITSYDHRVEMIEMARDSLSGVVFGRVDFSGSLGLERSQIESEVITSKIENIAQLCSNENLEFVLGGAISSESIENLRRITQIELTRFETRKVVFSGDSSLKEDIFDGLANAVHFELLWLLNKRDYYGGIAKEDQKRIEMLEARWELLNNNPN